MKAIGGPQRPGASCQEGGSADAYDPLLESVYGLAASIHELNVLVVQQYTPVIETILRSHTRDAEQTENTLDGLLSFCGYEPAILLFKRLCRYYYDTSPGAAVDCADLYRDHWDSGAEAQP